MRMLLGVVALATACGDPFYHDSRCADSDECDDPDTTTLVRWQFETFAGEAQPCPAGADVIEVTVYDSFELQSTVRPCSDGEVWLEPPFVPMTTRARALSSDGVLFAETLHTRLASPRPGPPGTLLVMLVDAGYLNLEWTFSGSCQPPGEVIVVATPVGGGASLEARRECMFGQSRIPLPAGEYDLAITGYDTLGSATLPSQRITIEAPNKVSATVDIHIER